MVAHSCPRVWGLPHAGRSDVPDPNTIWQETHAPHEGPISRTSSELASTTRRILDGHDMGGRFFPKMSGLATETDTTLGGDTMVFSLTAKILINATTCSLRVRRHIPFIADVGSSLHSRLHPIFRTLAVYPFSTRWLQPWYTSSGSCPQMAVGFQIHPMATAT